MASVKHPPPTGVRSTPRRARARLGRAGTRRGGGGRAAGPGRRGGSGPTPTRRWRPCATLGPLPRHDGLGARVAAVVRRGAGRAPQPGPRGGRTRSRAAPGTAGGRSGTRSTRCTSTRCSRWSRPPTPGCAGWWRGPSAAGTWNGCARGWRSSPPGCSTAAPTTLAAEGSFDVVEGFAEPLPVLVVAELLGWPAEDRHLLRPWSQAIVAMYELDPTPEAEARRAGRRPTRSPAYVVELARERSRRPTADLVSDLVAVRDAGDRLSEAELVATVVAAAERGSRGERQRVRQRARVLARRRVTRGRGRAAGRGDAAPRRPLQLFERTVLRPCTIAGVDLEPGERVAALLGAANRDPARSRGRTCSTRPGRPRT